MNLLEIGLEQELFLMKDNKILEPSLFGFPSDEMGFLIELRSWHSTVSSDILRSIRNLQTLANYKAKQLDFKIINKHQIKVDDKFMKYIIEKYKIDQMPDYTDNIYGIKETHHTGFSKDSYATAGLHVHFSKRVIKGSKAFIAPLNIPYIVTKMDNKFKDLIERDGRIMGEIEPKSHGFEYRSLSAIVSIDKVVDKALSILKESDEL